MPRLVPAATLGLVMTLPATAVAEPVLRPGLHGTFVEAEDVLAGGGRASFTGGYNLEYEPLLLIPEASLAGGVYFGDATGYSFRATAGFRFGFSYTFEPSLFLRGGYAHETLRLDVAGGEVIAGNNGGSIQTGLGADFRLSREMTFGPALTYDAGLFDGGTGGGLFVVHTLSLGATFAFWLQ